MTSLSWGILIKGNLKMVCYKMFLSFLPANYPIQPDTCISYPLTTQRAVANSNLWRDG